MARLRVDETAFLAGTARAHTQFITGLVDLKPAGAARHGCSTSCRAAPGPWSPSG